MIVDLLASEYGWAKDDILEKIYIDEVLHLIPHINRRNTEEYLMQLAITTNPHIPKHKDRKALWLELMGRIKEPAPETLDKAGFQSFKQTLMGTSNKISVK